MALLIENNAYSRVAASLAAGGTTLTVDTGTGDRFPIAASGNYFKLTLQDAANNIEIIKVTARAASSDSLTIERAQEGTTARAWSIGDIVELRLTAGVTAPLQVLEEADTAALIRGKIDVPTRTGGDATGTWGISITGNAASATVLQTARTINGVSFNGSANITITANTPNSLTPGAFLTGSAFNGSAAQTFAVDATNLNTANKVVARDASGNFSAGTITAALAGNASTATALQTERTINGVSFNGTANINVNLNNSIAFNNGGAGVASGGTFNGGSAVTVSYNTIGAPSTTGANASGTWGISITGNAATVTNGVYNDGATYGISISGNAATATTATRSNALNVPDTRSVVQGPGGLGQVVRADFLNNSTDGLNDGGVHHGVLTFNQWNDASGGGTRQLGFTDNDNLWLRGSGSEQTSYGPWKLMLNSLNYNAYAPTLTGGGASGTWAINITGNAGSAYGLGVQGAGSAPGANQVLRSDGNGYTFHNYINSNTGNSENPTISQVVVTNGGDNFYRKASIAHLGNSLNANGYQFVTQTGGSPAYYGARAWVRANASSGTPSVEASVNVSSVTDLGVGQFRVNMNTAQADTLYTISANGSIGGIAGGNQGGLRVAAISASSFDLGCLSASGGAFVDFDQIMAVIHR